MRAKQKRWSLACFTAKLRTFLSRMRTSYPPYPLANYWVGVVDIPICLLPRWITLSWKLLCSHKLSILILFGVAAHCIMDCTGIALPCMFRYGTPSIMQMWYSMTLQHLSDTLLVWWFKFGIIPTIHFILTGGEVFESVAKQMK